MNNLDVADAALEDARKAIDSYMQTVAICRETSGGRGKGISVEFRNIAETAGRQAESHSRGQQVLPIFEEVEDPNANMFATRR